MPKGQIQYTQVLLTYPQCKRTKEQLLEFIQGIEDICCAIISKENHHETEGEHLHAWIKYNKQQRIANSKWGSNWDWDGIHGRYDKVTCSARSIKDVVEYVMKDGDILTWNCDPDVITGKRKGRKYDTLRMLETDIKELVKNGEVSHRDYNSLVKAQSHWKLINAKLEDMEHEKGIWIVGPPRIGKSKSVRDYGAKHGGLYIKAQNKWWDGYQMEPNVLIDDFDTHTLWHHLKLWADCYSFPAEIKGATVNVNFKNLFITSNYTIEEIMKKGKEEEYDLTLLEALKARFKVIDWEDYKEKSDWMTCEIIERVIDGEVNEPSQKRTPECSLIDSLFGSGYQ